MNRPQSQNNSIKNLQTMEAGVIQNPLEWKTTQSETGYYDRTCFKAVVLARKSGSLFHKNLTVKIVLPDQNYKAQFSVKICLFVCLFAPFHLFLLHGRIRLYRTTAPPRPSNPRPPDLTTSTALEQHYHQNSFIIICTKNISLKGKELTSRAGIPNPRCVDQYRYVDNFAVYFIITNLISKSTLDLKIRW